MATRMGTTRYNTDIDFHDLLLVQLVAVLVCQHPESSHVGNRCLCVCVYVCVCVCVYKNETPLQAIYAL